VGSKGCSFLVAVVVLVIGLGLGYVKFRAKQEKTLLGASAAQWHDPLRGLLKPPAGLAFRNQALTPSGFLCGEFSLNPAAPVSGATAAAGYERFVVSPDGIAVAGARAYTQSAEAGVRRQRQVYQDELDALVAGGATPDQAFDRVAWSRFCRGRP
jgi:hypothetical protein